MFKRIKKFFGYLLSKKDELKDLDVKDALLAKTVIDIHRKRTHSSFEMVPLYYLKQIHPINRDNALKKTEQRTEVILKVKDELLQKKKLSRELLNDYIPSVSGIKVVKENSNSFIAYEGNGRLVALQKAFKESDNMLVEVEVYYFKSPKKILRRMNRLRKMHGFI